MSYLFDGIDEGGTDSAAPALYSHGTGAFAAGCWIWDADQTGVGSFPMLAYYRTFGRRWTISKTAKNRPSSTPSNDTDLEVFIWATNLGGD